MPQTVGECFELIEREMLAGPWVMGEAYTICDPYLFTLAHGWRATASTSPASPRCTITAAHGGAPGGREGAGRREGAALTMVNESR